MKIINPYKTLPEIFEIVIAEPTKTKASTLKRYDTRTLRWFVNAFYNYDWSGIVIPNFTMPTRPVGNCNLTIGRAMSRIDQAHKYRFDNTELSQRNLLIVLEEISKEEAELLVHMMTGKKRIVGIPTSVFKECYPELFVEEKAE